MKIGPYINLKLLIEDSYGELYAGFEESTRLPALIRVYTEHRSTLDRLRENGHKDPHKVLDRRIKAAINQAETLSGERYFPEVGEKGFLTGNRQWISFHRLPATLEMVIGPDEAISEKSARYAHHTSPQQLDTERALYIGGQLLDAVQELHSFRRLHRGLSPQAVALSAEGDIKLIDMGHAPNIAAKATAGDSALFAYLPEALHTPGGKIDIKAEIYALGGLIRRLIMGPDWQKDSPPQNLVDSYGPDFFTIIDRAQGRLLGERYIQTAEMVADYETAVVDWERRTNLSIDDGRQEIKVADPDEPALAEPEEALKAKTSATASKTTEEEEEDLISSLGLSPNKSANAGIGNISPQKMAIILGSVLLASLALLVLLTMNSELTPDDIAYQEATAIGTREAIEAYMADWPAGDNLNNAERFLARLDADENRARSLEERAADNAAWVAATTDNTDEALEDYLDTFPDGRHREEALTTLERNAFREALRSDEFGSIEQFMADYPTTRYRSDMDDKSWILAKDAATLEALDTYLALFPGGSHEEEATELRRLISERLEQERSEEDDRFWAEVKEEDTETAYENYLTEQTNGRYRVEAEAARFLLEQERLIAEAKARLVRAHQVEFIRLGYRNIVLNGEEDAATKKAVRSYLTWSESAEILPIGDTLLARLRATTDKPLPTVFSRLQDCTDCPEMLVLPAGQFQMGSPVTEVGRSNPEGPVQTITLPVPFAIGFTEVTRAQWRACVSAGMCNPLNLNGVNFEEDATPITEVPFPEAVKYTEWLSQTTGHTYRLPTEAEWEYAARANTTTPFSFGASFREACAHANTDDLAQPPAGAGWIMQPCQDGLPSIAAVGLLNANRFGLFDMHGNAEEWTMDCWQASLENKPADGSAYRLTGTRSCSLYVVKGGSYLSTTAAARSAARRGISNGINPTRLRGIGLRIVRDLTS